MNAAPRSERKPFGVLLIAGFYAFGAIVLLLGLFINPTGVSQVIAERHGLLPALA